MVGIESNTPTYLPREIIESILSRLPLKSLLRFKSVCKQWNAIISDSKFAQTHLHISKNSSSLSYIILKRGFFNATVAPLVRFENDEFRRLPAVYYPPLVASFCFFLCHCDGLYLIAYQRFRGDEYEYALCNPSRRSCKNLNQYTFNYYPLIRGICYDPLLDDYKVVMGGAKHYAVFYCKKNQWSDPKEMNPNFDIHGSGAPLKGSIYWINFQRKEDGLGYVDEYEIVYFDGRDEKWKNQGKVGIDASDKLELISSGEGLYLFRSNWSFTGKMTVPLFMKKVGDDNDDNNEWMELKVEVTTTENGNIGSLPVHCGHGNKLLVRHPKNDCVVIYDGSKKSLTRVGCNWYSIFGDGPVFPYQENMFWD